MSNIKYCMSADVNNIIVSTGYGFKSLPDGNILISKSQYGSGITGKKIISLPEYDESNNVTKDAILEDV